MVPETFFHYGRIAIEDNSCKKQSAAAKPSALIRVANILQKKLKKSSAGRPVMEFKFKLPVQCKTSFVEKPFILMYPNDYSNQRVGSGNNYRMLHIDLHAAAEPEKQEKKVKESKAAFASPLDKSLDQSSSDSGTEDGNMQDDNENDANNSCRNYVP